MVASDVSIRERSLMVLPTVGLEFKLLVRGGVLKCEPSKSDYYEASIRSIDTHMKPSKLLEREKRDGHNSRFHLHGSGAVIVYFLR